MIRSRDRRPNFWKSVGGYLACAKLGGRWYFVGTTAEELRLVHADMRRRGIQPVRAQGMPTSLNRFWRLYGSTVAALKEHLPPYPFLEDVSHET